MAVIERPGMLVVNGGGGAGSGVTAAAADAATAGRRYPAGGSGSGSGRQRGRSGGANAAAATAPMLTTAQRVGAALHLVVGWGLVALLAWAPLPLGSNQPWSWLLLVVAAALLLAAWSVAQAIAPRALRMPAVVVLAGLATACVWAWALAQSLPVAELPGRLGLAAHPVWADAAAAGLGGVVPLVGLEAAGTRDALARLIGYAVVFWLAFAVAQGEGWARRLLQILLGLAVVNALLGLWSYFSGAETILWIPKEAYIGDVTGTFVNRNHFATYANLGLLIAVALLVEPFLAARSAGDVRRIFVEVVERLLGRRVVLLMAVAVLVTAVLQSHSRGGFLSLVLALAAMFVAAFLITRPRPQVAAAVIGGLLAIGAGFVWVSGDRLFERLTILENQDLDNFGGNRLTIWSDSLALAEERPLVGQGYGGFEEAFATRRTELYDLVVDYAHDTYIEHLVELGWPATLLLYAGPLLLFGYVVRGLAVRRRDLVFPLVAVSGTVLVATHALVDFSLQIPAMAVTYAALLGLGVATAIPSPKKQDWGASLRD